MTLCSLPPPPIRRKNRKKRAVCFARRLGGHSYQRCGALRVSALGTGHAPHVSSVQLIRGEENWQPTVHGEEDERGEEEKKGSTLFEKEEQKRERREEDKRKRRAER